jgi:hypothetical protein
MATKDIGVRLDQTIDAWQRMRGDKRFFGLSVEDLKQRAKPYYEAREALRTLGVQWDQELRKRAVAAAPLSDLLQCIASAVAGDPEEGHNGELYAAMGYVPKNQRASGLVRKSATVKRADPDGGGS